LAVTADQEFGVIPFDGLGHTGGFVKAVRVESQPSVDFWDLVLFALDCHGVNGLFG